MCFNICKQWQGIPSVAKKDIVCYKILGEGRSYYYDYKYINNYKQPEVKLIVRTKYGHELFIDEGYHSYKSKSIAKQWVPGYSQCLKYYSIVEFIIPKGATYYENDSEYVSSTIIRKRIIRKIKYSKTHLK